MSKFVLFLSERFKESKEISSIGPGHYSIVEKPKKPTYIGFGLSQQRFPEKKNDTPGPGFYNIQDVDKKNTKSSVFSTVFRNQINTNPIIENIGVGQYTILGDFDKIRIQKEKMEQEKFLSKNKKKEKKIEWVKTRSVPSIPAVNQCFGYSEDDYGVLHPQQSSQYHYSGKGSDSVGPQYYQVKEVTKSIPTFDFSKSVSKKSWNQTNDNPGPGTYTLTTDHIKKSSKPTITQSKRFVEKHEDIPGPGSYNISRSIPLTHAVKWKLPEKKVVDKIETPGPGSYFKTSLFPYRPPHSAPNHRVKSYFKQQNEPKSVGFNSSSKRFADNNTNSPGPGYYCDTTNTLNNYIQKNHVHGPPFGSSTSRFPKTYNTDVPGPANYSYPKKDIIKTYCPPFTGFGSSAPRFIEKIDEGPSPCSYSIADSNKKIPTFRISKTERFKKTSHSNTADHIGPGSYFHESTYSSPCPANSVFNSSSSKFPEKTSVSSVPGPGSYNINTDTILKKSFNVTAS